MFQPPPATFSSLYPAYLALPVDDNGVRDDLIGLDGLSGLSGLDDFQVTGYCSYQQAPYLSGPVTPRGNPGPCGDGLGGAAGVGPTAPLSASVLDNCNRTRQPPPPPLPSQHQHFPPVHSAAPSIVHKMEQSQSFQDELAAQEAAARTWQPELEVCPALSNPRSAALQRLGASSANRRLGTVQGPRVGDKTPIAAITEEYAKADPIYVAKTSVSFSVTRGIPTSRTRTDDRLGVVRNILSLQTCQRRR